MTQKRAIIELLVADLFWGFSFVAIPLAQQAWSSSQITFIRFFVPAIIGIFAGLGFRRLRLTRSEFLRGVLPGFLFAATIYIQTVGLEFTTPSKSSFITVLYVLFVPILEIIITRKPVLPHFWVYLMGALVGMSLLLKLDWSHWNKGDTMTLICALFATWHIHQVGISTRYFSNALRFNITQCFWASVFLIPFTIEKEMTWIPSVLNLTSIAALLMIVVGATMIGFTIQARAQAHLSLSTSAVIFLLESPFAMFFSWLILKEEINLLQLLGALIILVSCYFAVKATTVKGVLQMETTHL